ncbi:MAG TPA: hypothetical protein PKD64_07310 [Pirellulaceae bacterium]|nr:hypothetical protein [Pirellulaceae bacterium]HMO91993.1 hypothetical protein [Pirellulaceae bacterium]HMP68792.1 hypothetical protein [Pirellulaceae bacterium]
MIKHVPGMLTPDCTRGNEDCASECKKRGENLLPVKRQIAYFVAVVFVRISYSLKIVIAVDAIKIVPCLDNIS